MKLDINNHKNNQTVCLFTNGRQEFIAETRSLREVALQIRKTVVKCKIAILLESKLVVNKERSRLEMHYDFNHEDIMKETKGYFAT